MHPIPVSLLDQRRILPSGVAQPGRSEGLRNRKESSRKKPRSGLRDRGRPAADKKPLTAIDRRLMNDQPSGVFVLTGRTRVKTPSEEPDEPLFT